MTILSAIVVLGLLIFIHELGHFLAAKKTGVGVLKFSLGFGPKIFGFKRGETEYLLSAIPLGGYVKMIGEDSKDEELAPDKSFSQKSVKTRALIISAGPAANFLLAIIIFWVVFMVGVPTLTPLIGEIKEGFPAEEKGLRAGDRIVAFEGKPIRRWEDLAVKVHRSPGRPVHITIERDGDLFDLTITPKPTKQKNIFGEEQEIGLLGIAPSEEFVIERADPITALYLAFIKTVYLIRIILISLVKLIQRVIPLSSIGGPILVAQMAGEQARVGFLSLFLFTAVLSVNLGVLNLLPIPILDGGHLLFAALEGLRGKPISLKKREIAQQIGLAFLIGLMIFAFYNDIFRLFHRQ